MSEKIDPDRNDEDRAAAPEVSGEPAPESRPAEPEVHHKEGPSEDPAADADRPENADVIVYASAKPDPKMAHSIASAVRQGKALYC